MSPWYEVYDNDQVHMLTRMQAARMTVTATVALMFAIGCMAFGLEGTLPIVVAAPAGVGALVLFAWRCGKQLRQLRRLVWCVKLCDREIVGYDYARRKITIPWSSAERIELGDRSLVVVGPNTDLLEVAHLFPDFPEVSHRIADYAEDHQVPLFISGKPWQQLNLYEVYPFLSEDTPSSTHGSAAA